MVTRVNDTPAPMRVMTRSCAVPIVVSLIAAGASGCAQIAKHEQQRAVRAEAGEQEAFFLPPRQAAFWVPTSREAETSLIHAAETSDLATVVRLLASGVNVNASVVREYGMPGETALGAAARVGNREIARRLLTRGADPNRRDRYGTPPLSYAVRDGDPQLTEWLLRAGADPDAKEALGYTPLMRAVLAGRIALVARLLRAAPDLTLHDGEGFTALHHAVLLDRREAARQLLAAGAPREARDREGKTPLYLALIEGREEIALLLLAQGADPSQTFEGRDMAYYAGWARAERVAAAIEAKTRR